MLRYSMIFYFDFRQAIALKRTKKDIYDISDIWTIYSDFGLYKIVVFFKVKVLWF